jgi:hypothetical protein
VSIRGYDSNLISSRLPGFGWLDRCSTANMAVLHKWMSSCSNSSISRFSSLTQLHSLHTPFILCSTVSFGRIFVTTLSNPLSSVPVVLHLSPSRLHGE